MKKAKSSKTKPMPSLKSILAVTYIFLMTVIFPLYTKQGFIRIADAKRDYYYWISGVFFVLSLVVLVATLIRNKGFALDKIQLSALDYAVLAYLGIQIISFIFSPYKYGTFIGFSGWSMGLVSQLAMVFGYFLVRNWYGSGKTAWVFISVGLITEATLIVSNRLGDDAFHFYDWMDWFDWTRRNLVGTIGNSNWACAYLIFTFPVLLILYTRTKRLITKFLVGLGLSITMAAILIQGSRSGIPSLAVILLVFLLFYVKTISDLTRYLEILNLLFLFPTFVSIFHIQFVETNDERFFRLWDSYLWFIPMVITTAVVIIMNVRASKKREKDAEKEIPSKLRLVTRLTALVIAVMGIVAFVVLQFSDALWNALGSPSSLRLSDSWGSGRWELWRKSIITFFTQDRARLVCGFGPDAYGYWFVSKGLEIQTKDIFTGAIYANAHNEWITMLINAGIMGLLSYLALFASAFKSFAGKGKKAPYEIAGVLLLCGCLVNQFFSFQQVCATPIFFILLGLCENHKKCLKSPDNN